MKALIQFPYLLVQNIVAKLKSLFNRNNQADELQIEDYEMYI